MTETEILVDLRQGINKLQIQSILREHKGIIGPACDKAKLCH